MSSARGQRSNASFKHGQHKTATRKRIGNLSASQKRQIIDAHQSQQQTPTLQERGQYQTNKLCRRLQIAESEKQKKIDSIRRIKLTRDKYGSSYSNGCDEFYNLPYDRETEWKRVEFEIELLAEEKRIDNLFWDDDND